MKVLIESGDQYSALRDQYKSALREWTAARAARSPEFLEITKRLDELEQALNKLRPTVLVKYQPPN